MSDCVLCHDCLDTGWLQDSEGRSPCPCVSETEPYQLLQAENERLREAAKYDGGCPKDIYDDAKRYCWLRQQEKSIVFFGGGVCVTLYPVYPTEQTLDAVIDEAMKDD